MTDTIRTAAKNPLAQLLCRLMEVTQMADKKKRDKKIQRQNWKPYWLTRVLYMFWRVLYSGIKVCAGAVATVGLILVICGFVFVGILGGYLQDEIIPLAEVNLDDYELDKTSSIYGLNADGDVVLLQVINSTTDRRWVAFEDIPEELIHATVALEDKRFYEHQGVDWITTIKACLNMFMGGSSQFGGSTITQQLIKNLFLTEDERADDVTVQRKLLEIFRALEFEKRYDKDVVMEYYLNVIFFGRGCYGVQSAAETYFGKDLHDMTVAEFASLISITNNPYRYDPYRPDPTSSYQTGAEENRTRQLYCLKEMKSQGWLTEKEYNKAVAQEMIFKSGIKAEDRWAECQVEACGYEGAVRTLIQEETGYRCPICGEWMDIKADNSQEVYSYYVDTVILDLAAYLAEQDGLVWEELDKTVRENYLLLIQRRGYHIYTPINLEVQAQVDKIYQDLNEIPETRSGQQLQSAIVIIDNMTGDIVAMAGGVGEKTDFLSLNRATQSRLQTGSSIKPLAVYAPAFELGVITPASVISDMPLYYKSDGTPWPRNDNKTYAYSRTVLQGVVNSLNGISLNTLDSIGTQYSYNFAKNKFHLTGLTNRFVTSSGSVMSDMDFAPLGTGSLTVGVTVRDMAAAYATFANGGVWREGRTFTKVYDSDGNLVIDNTQNRETILSQKTVDYMNYCLDQAIESGTGKKANFSGMDICGKTGTTANSKDRYFCGYTGYYTAAVWCGYDTPEVIKLVGDTTNPSIQLWKKIMEPIHQGLESIPLVDYDKMEEVSVCLDCGKLADTACSKDVREINRVSKAWVYKEDMPKEFCDCHVLMDYCTVGGGVANEYCKKFRDVGALSLDKKSLAKKTQAQVNRLTEALNSGLTASYLKDIYIYLVDSRGNDLPFYGIRNDLLNPSGTPYVCCEFHNQATWEAYVAEHPWIEGDSTEPTEPSEPIEPTEPFDPTNPTMPTDPDAPTEPTVNPEPTEPTEATEPEESGWEWPWNFGT